MSSRGQPGGGSTGGPAMPGSMLSVVNDSGDLLALVGAVGKSGKLFLCPDGSDTDDAVQQVVDWLQLHGATAVAERRISAGSFDSAPRIVSKSLPSGAPADAGRRRGRGLN